MKFYNMAIESNHSGTEIEVPMTQVLSLRDSGARKKAASLVHRGMPIGSYNRGVCAIWGDGGNPAFPQAVAEIKGEARGARPLAASLSTEQFVGLLDMQQFPQSLRDTFSDAKKLAAHTGSLCFFRGPVTESAARELPPALVSYIDGVPVVQNWDARGHNPTHRLLEAMRTEGVKFPAVTSMNKSGMPEITDQQEGIEFSRQNGVPLFLEDAHDPKRAVGSYTILGISSTGINLIREGNIPSNLLQELLGTEIDTSGATIAKSLQPLDFPIERIQGVNPRIARFAILSSLSTDRASSKKVDFMLRAGRVLKKD